MPLQLNTSIFQGVRGILRITTLVIGLIDLGITADKYLTFAKEEFYLAIVIIAFFFSLVWTILLLLQVLGADQAELVKNIDSFAHVGLGAFLLISMICWFISVVRYGDPCDWWIPDPRRPYLTCPHSFYILRVLAGILGLANGVVYLVLGAFVFTGQE